MARPVLKRGSKHRDAVGKLQDALKRLGYYRHKIDGDFGPKTEDAVCQLQLGAALEVDGIVGPITWAVIEEKLPVADPPEVELPSWVLDGFEGDADWIHKWEGHAGKPYWPGGASGVTVDPGVDLGHIGGDLISIFRDLYGDYLSEDQLDSLLASRGLKGIEAREYLEDDNNTVLHSIRISRAEAGEIFPYALDPYWDATMRRFPSVLTAPPVVHTVMTSLAYNRGPYNPRTSVLRDPLERQDYETLGSVIKSMQQNHQLRGIRRRRKAEGRLILESL
jgi:GH24 family phage-related lysozyme (muramidase)